jgi:DNA-binding NarL/FixJ family response regulator
MTPSKAETRITVVLAEDHTLVREGLRALLKEAGDISVVGEAENGLQAIEITNRLSPDVTVLDIAMPELNGLQAARRLRRESPRTKIILLSMHSDEEFIRQAIQLGIEGYLIKDTAAPELLKAIREVAGGNSYFSPSISKVLLQRCRDVMAGYTATATGSRLTGRETEVLQLVAEGMTNRQISEKLFVSLKTVEKHREHIMKKLDIHDVAGLTRYAVREGIVGGKAPRQ